MYIPYFLTRFLQRSYVPLVRLLLRRPMRIQFSRVDTLQRQLKDSPFHQHSQHTTTNSNIENPSKSSTQITNIPGIQRRVSGQVYRATSRNIAHPGNAGYFYMRHSKTRLRERSTRTEVQRICILIARPDGAMRISSVHCFLGAPSIFLFFSSRVYISRTMPGSLFQFREKSHRA